MQSAMQSGICKWRLLGHPSARTLEHTGKAGGAQLALRARRRIVSLSGKHDTSNSSQKSLDTLDLLLNSADPDPEDDFDEAARASVSEILEQQEAQTVQEADSSTVDAAVRQQPDASTSAPGPEALLEALLAGKLTSSMVLAAGKAAAKKWVRDKTTPKTSLLAAFGAEDHGIRALPFLSYGVLIVNLAVYMAGLGVRFSLGESSGESYFYGLAKVNDEVVQGEYYRLVTSAFLHDSFSHLALNTYALYTVAPEVEAVLGHWSFLSVYLLSGLAGSSAAFVFGDTITVGASTCIFGLIGGLGGYMWKNRAVNQSSDQLLSIAGIAAISLALGWSDETTVDNLGHIVGGLTGILLGWAIGPTFLPPVEQEGASDLDKQSQPSTPPPPAAMQMQNASSSETGSAPKTMRRRNDSMDGIRRVSISAAFMAGLISIVASTVIDRVGHLPMPKGLGF